MKSKNNSPEENPNKKQKSSGSAIETNNNAPKQHEESTSSGKQEIDFGDIPKDMNVDENNHNSVDDLVHAADENEVFAFDNDTIQEELNWINCFLTKDDLVEQDSFNQTDSSIFHNPSDDVTSFDSSTLQLLEVNPHTDDTISLDQEANAALLIDDLRNLKAYNKYWDLLSPHGKTFYKEKLQFICQSSEYLDQNFIWARFFHEMLTFSLSNRQTKINLELFDLESYLVLSLHLAKKTKEDYALTDAKEVIFLSLQRVFGAGKQVTEKVLLTKPTSSWQQLSINSWIDFYIQFITKQNVLPASRALFLSLSPAIYKHIELTQLTSIQEKPTLLDLYVSLITQNNVLVYFLPILITRNAPLIQKALSKNPLISNFLARKLNRDNILDVMRNVIWSKNLEFITEFIDLKIYPHGKESTVFEFYCHTLSKIDPLKARQHIRNWLQIHSSKVIETIFNHGCSFEGGFFGFYLNLDSENRQAIIKSLLLSRSSLVERCISTPSPWLSSKTILEFYIDSLKPSELNTPELGDPVTILTSLFHTSSMLTDALLALKMPEWAENKFVLDFYFESHKDNLPMLVRNIFCSHNLDFIKACMAKKLLWVKDTPSLFNAYTSSLVDETALEEYISLVLNSHHSEWITSLMRAPLPWNNEMTVLSWYLSSPEHLVSRINKILGSTCLPIIEEITSVENNAAVNYLTSYFDLKTPLPNDDSPISNLDCEILLARLHNIISARQSINWLFNDNELLNNKSLFLCLLRPHLPAIQENMQLKLQWDKLFEKLLHMPGDAISKNKIFSEIIGTISLNQSWIELLKNYHQLKNRIPKKWLSTFLEEFISERKQACLSCITLLEKENMPGSIVINLSDGIATQIQELLNAFHVPCFTLVLTSTQYQLHVVSKEGCEKLKKELNASFIQNVETHEEVLKEILIRVIQNPQKKLIPFDQVLDEETLKSINKKYKKNYFSIALRKGVPQISVTSELGCIELAKEFGIEIGNSFLELNNNVAKSEKNTRMNDALKIILTEIIKAPLKAQTIVAEGIFTPVFKNKINQQYKEYFEIESRKKTNCFAITNFDRSACLTLATQLGLKIAASNFDQISVSQQPALLFPETNSNTPVHIETVTAPTLDESGRLFNEILNLESSSRIVNNSSIQEPIVEARSSDNLSINDASIDAGLKYVLTKIAQSNSKYIQITKEEVKNIKNRLRLNETYKHCFHISSYRGGAIEIINQAECQKLIEEMGIARTSSLVQPNLSRPQSVTALQTPTIPYRDSSQFRFSFATPTNRGLSSEAILEIDALLGPDKPH